MAEPNFKSAAEELTYHINEAEQHARKAHDMLYSGSNGLKRSLWFKTVLGRAQSILMSLHVQELNRKERSDDQRRSKEGEVQDQDHPT